MVLDDLRQPLLRRIHDELSGVHGLVVSDRDGVVVLRAIRDEVVDKVDAYTRPSYLSTYSSCAERAARMMLGPGHSMVVSVSGLTVVHAAHDNLVVTILADPKEALIAQMLDFAKSLKPLTDDIARTCVVRD